MTVHYLPGQWRPLSCINIKYTTFLSFFPFFFFPYSSCARMKQSSASLLEVFFLWVWKKNVQNHFLSVLPTHEQSEYFHDGLWELVRTATCLIFKKKIFFCWFFNFYTTLKDQKLTFKLNCLLVDIMNRCVK